MTATSVNPAPFTELVSRNRTTALVFNHGIPNELKKGARGIPVVAREELTFAGRALAAKWLLSKTGLSHVHKGDGIHFVYYGDRYICELESIIGPLCDTVDKSGVLPERFAERVREIAESPEENAADAAYCRG
jgi:hypothetical protein